MKKNSYIQTTTSNFSDIKIHLRSNQSLLTVKQLRIKNILTYLLLFYSVAIYAQTKTKIVRKTLIDIETVNYMRVGKFLKKQKCISDSCWNCIYKNIDPSLNKYIIDQWNAAEYAGEKKKKARFFIWVYLKDGSMKTININAGLNEIKNYWFLPSDKKFFDKLWKNTK